MRTPEEIAMDCIQHAIECGMTPDEFLRSWQCTYQPDRGDGSIQINIAGGYVYPDLTSTERIKVKPFQIGVAMYRKDTFDAYGIFDARELWQAIVNPPPKQLSLFDEVMS